MAISWCIFPPTHICQSVLPMGCYGDMIVRLVLEIATAAFSHLAMTFFWVGILYDKSQLTVPEYVGRKIQVF